MLQTLERPTGRVLEMDLTLKQLEALSCLCDHDIDELLYGGAKGGGKTVLGCYWVYFMCKKIIKDFDLTPTKYPPVVGFMGRKVGKSFKSTTLNTWKKIIPEAAYEIKMQDGQIVIEGTVAVDFGGLDETDEGSVKKFNSAEYAFAFIDQAEETTETDIGMMRGTMRLKINGEELNYKILLTANPRGNWVKKNFISVPQPRTKFIQALPSDNTHLASTYVETLKKAFQYRPELLNAYLYGSWDELDIGNYIIPETFVRKCVNNKQHDNHITKKITVLDIAEDGEDETVIYDLENTKVVDQEIYRYKDLMDTTGRAIAHAIKNGSNMICGDVVGLGAGVMSRLREVYRKKSEDQEKVDMTIMDFDGREEPTDKLTFANRKIEAWWQASEDFRELRCDIPDDPVLISQLAGIPYTFTSSGKLIVIGKKEIKKLIGRSPDRATTYVMGLWALRNAKPIVKRDPYDRRGRRMEVESPDAV